MDMPFKLLFLCTHNACRSVLSEVTARRLGGERVEAASAGSHPAGRIHPQTLRYLERVGIATEGLKSQSWDEFEDFHPDAVITVCDNAANEVCPLWMGEAVKAHWGVKDPSRVEGGQAAINAAFDEIAALLQRRIEALLALPLEELREDPKALAAALKRIAETIQ
jgi:arsenate reductase